MSDFTTLAPLKRSPLFVVCIQCSYMSPKSRISEIVQNYGSLGNCRKFSKNTVPPRRRQQLLLEQELYYFKFYTSSHCWLNSITNYQHVVQHNTLCCLIDSVKSVASHVLPSNTRVTLKNSFSKIPGKISNLWNCPKLREFRKLSKIF
jgi:hypothetical protein